MNRIFLLLLLFLFSATLYAQTTAQKPAGKVWTLRECVEYALANNINVQRSTYGVESASIDHKQAKMAMIPSLNASASSGFNWGRSINPVTNLFTTQEVISFSPNASSSVTLLTDSGCRTLSSKPDAIFLHQNMTLRNQKMMSLLMSSISISM